MSGSAPRPLRAEDVLVGVRFMGGLRAFLRHPVDVAEARATLRSRLDSRHDNFLRTVREIFAHAGGPYRALLRRSGCEYGDLEGLVTREGVEGALRVLLQQGVYMTVDELKGRRPVVRGNLTLHVGPEPLRNRRTKSHLLIRTGGSRGGGDLVRVDLAFVREFAVDKCLHLAARAGLGWEHAHWGVAGGGAINQLLRFAAVGAPPAGWFCQDDPGVPGLAARSRWSARALAWGSALAGRPMPRPESAPLEEPAPVARWMARTLRAGRTPHLNVLVSGAVRLCQDVLAAGSDLEGARFTLSGEPITESRLAPIRRAGGEVIARYGSAETASAIGYGCLAPDTVDDVHLLHDLHAVVQPDLDTPPRGLPSRALFITSLSPRSPLVLLNVSLGDEAVLVRRACGCALERAGWTTHLHTIRSYEKLTAAGVPLPRVDLVRLLDEVLPARFGGGPTHYQLLAEEGGRGPRLRILVHPDAGRVDDAAIGRAAAEWLVARVEDLSARSATEQLTVERRPPLVTPAGKIGHVHLVAPRGGESGVSHQARWALPILPPPSGRP